MDKLYAIKIRQSDGTYGDEIPINVLAQNVDWDSSHTLVDILGVVDTTSPIQSQINNLVNTKASQAHVNLLETRVDNIIANAGDDNTEIVDIRTGVDGTVYSNAGNAVRSQITDVKSAINANAASITNLSSHKVNIPLDNNSQPTNGTNGQTLRTKGNGATEWANVGLPTDEQTAQAVSDWLDDHPEATTTVDFAVVTKVFQNVTRMTEDLTLEEGDTVRTCGYYAVNDGGAALYKIVASDSGLFTESLSNGLYAELIFEAPLNALQIGVSPSIDNSALLNDALSKTDVYLPSGQYPCNGVTAVYNLSGEGTRVNDRTSGTWLVSNGSETVLTIGKAAQISGISVWCIGTEHGIALTQNEYGYALCENVTVANVSGIGVDLTATTSAVASRRIYVNGLRIFGASTYPASIGLNIGGTAGDLKVDNIEVMGCRMGVSFNNRIVSGINWHIWCGCLAGVDNGSWWRRTVGLFFATGARVNVENLYLDTCHLGIYFEGFGNSVSVKNFVFVEDTSAGKVATRDGWMINSNGSQLTNMLVIDGGYITIRGNDATPYNMVGLVPNSRLNTLIKNAVYALDYLPTFANIDLLRRDMHYTPQYSIRSAPTAANTYVEVARIIAGASARYIAKLSIYSQAAYKCDLTVARLSGGYNISATEDASSAFKTFYKVNDTDGYISIYVRCASAGVFTANVFCEAVNANATIVDYGLTRLRSGTESVDYPRDITTDSTGMIAVAA